jgi:hypothetical protein
MVFHRPIECTAPTGQVESESRTRYLPDSSIPRPTKVRIKQWGQDVERGRLSRLGGMVQQRHDRLGELRQSVALREDCVEVPRGVPRALELTAEHRQPDYLRPGHHASNHGRRLDAVQQRHHQVKHDQVAVEFRRLLDSLNSVARLRTHPMRRGALDVVPDRGAHGGVVVDDEYCAGGHRAYV